MQIDEEMAADRTEVVERWSKMKRSDTIMIRHVLRHGGKIPDDIGPTIIQTLRRMVANNAHKRVEREVLEMPGVGLSAKDYFRPNPPDKPSAGRVV